MAELWAWNIANEIPDARGKVWTFDRCPEKLKKRVAACLKDMGADEYITDDVYR